MLLKKVDYATKFIDVIIICYDVSSAIIMTIFFLLMLRMLLSVHEMMIEVSIMLIFIKVNQFRFVIAHALILKRAFINHFFNVKIFRREPCDDHEIIY